MIRSMLRLLIIVAISSSFVLADNEVPTDNVAKMSTVDSRVISFFRLSAQQNPNVRLKDVKISSKSVLKEIPGWYAYIISFDILVPPKNKQTTLSNTIFTNGEYVTNDFISLDTFKSLSEDVYIPVDNKYYDKEHLLYGEQNSKTKILIFTDPRCPYCLDLLPKVIDFVKDNPKDYSLYVYHFPLEMIHPRSATITKAMIALKQMGQKDVLKKMYSLDLSSLNPSEKTLLDSINKEFNSKLTPEIINSKKVISVYEADKKAGEDLAINATPTIFIDGKKESTVKLDQIITNKDKNIDTK